MCSYYLDITKRNPNYNSFNVKHILSPTFTISLTPKQRLRFQDEEAAG